MPLKFQWVLTSPQMGFPSVNFHCPWKSISSAGHRTPWVGHKILMYYPCAAGEAFGKADSNKYCSYESLDMHKYNKYTSDLYCTLFINNLDQIKHRNGKERKGKGKNMKKLEEQRFLQICKLGAHTKELTSGQEE